MKLCPTCGREFPDDTKFCPVDGTTLRAKAAGADLVGQIVADRYHILKKLGEGGMGAVYLGEHVKMGRKSAIKVMAPSMAQDPDAISRFNREAANASRISHPNVCQVYDFGETPDGLIFLAMEFIEGQSLTSLIEKEGALSAPRAAAILRQSADALQAAHDLGIVHRDIKPDNIMIVQGRDGSDVVKVVDFGIARAVGGDESGQKVTKTGLVVGTPEYMSPEQLSGDKLDGRSDLYSVGLVLYRMLTGTLPFQADSAQETMIKRLTDDPTPLAVSRPDIPFPDGLQLVLDRALARMRDDRYQSAAQFGQETMAAVAGMATPQTRVAPAATGGATQLLDEDAVRELTTKQKAASGGARGGKAPPPTRGSSAAPAPPPRKTPVALIAGGAVGFLAVAGTIAVMMMKGGANGAAADTTGTPGQQIAANPDTARGGTDTQKVVPNSRPTNPGTQIPGTQKTDPPPVNPGGNPPRANWADTLTAANTAFDNDDFAATRRLAEQVFNNTTGEMKVGAAVLMGTSFGAVGNNDRAIEWYRRAASFATGERRDRIENTIRGLGGTP